jgi:hypothetical protein
MGGNVSASHVSSVLRKAGYPKASEPRKECPESGFYVETNDVENLGRTVIVGYQDYDYENDYSNRARDAITRICEEAFDAYAETLRKASYETENWLRYDGVRLSLFVTERTRNA